MQHTLIIPNGPCLSAMSSNVSNSQLLAQNFPLQKLNSDIPPPFLPRLFFSHHSPSLTFPPSFLPTLPLKLYLIPSLVIFPSSSSSSSLIIVSSFHNRVEAGGTANITSQPSTYSKTLLIFPLGKPQRRNIAMKTVSRHMPMAKQTMDKFMSHYPVQGGISSEQCAGNLIRVASAF